MTRPFRRRAIALLATMLGAAAITAVHAPAATAAVTATGDTFVAGTYLPPSSNSNVAAPGAVARGADGSVYVIGHDTSFATSTPLPAPFGSPGGNSGNYVAKFSADLSQVAWVHYFPPRPNPQNTGRLHLDGLAVSPDGSVTVTGLGDEFWATTPGSLQPEYRGISQSDDPNNVGSYDHFVPVAARLSPAGGLVWSTYLGTSDPQRLRLRPSDVAIDPGTGLAWITGTTTDRGFPTTAGAAQRVWAGDGETGYLIALDPAGQSRYATYISGQASGTIPVGVGVDGNGSIHVGGQTVDPTLPTTAGAYQRLLAPNDRTAFVMRFHQGTTFLGAGPYVRESSTFVNRGAAASKFAIDRDGNGYFVGSPGGNFQTTAGALQPTRPGGREDGFVQKIDAAGSSLLFATFLGSSDDGDQHADIPTELVPLADGSAWVSGFTNGTDFPLTADSVFGPAPGFIPAYATRLSGDGRSVLSSTLFGAHDDPIGIGTRTSPFGLSGDGADGVYLTGTTGGDDLPVSARAFLTEAPKPTGGEPLYAGWNFLAHLR